MVLKSNLWKNDIKRITDPPTTRHRREHIPDSLLVFRVSGIERNMAEVAIGDF